MTSELTTTSDNSQATEKHAIQEEGTRPGPVFRPDVDILEHSDAYMIFADLPGADDKHVDVRLEKGVLTLDAQLATTPDSHWDPIYTEYRFGGYHREFRISEEIDTNNVSASMRNGVLELRLPKTPEHQRQTITVQAG